MQTHRVLVSLLILCGLVACVDNRPRSEVSTMPSQSPTPERPLSVNRETKILKAIKLRQELRADLRKLPFPGWTSTRQVCSWLQLIVTGLNSLCLNQSL